MLTRATLTRKIVGERDIVTEGGATLPNQRRDGDVWRRKLDDVEGMTLLGIGTDVMEIAWRDDKWQGGEKYQGTRIFNDNKNRLFLYFVSICLKFRKCSLNS